MSDRMSEWRNGRRYVIWLMNDICYNKIMYPKNKVNCVWSSRFAYAIGLLTTDGCLSKDKRHIDFTSKDLELIEIFKDYLRLDNKIGKKTRDREKEKRYFHVQFGDVNFYEFLVKIGLTPAKSKTIGPLQIPNRYFFDFLRGCIDGDGNINTYKHPESRHPQLRVRIASASKKFLQWIQNKTIFFLGIKGIVRPAEGCYCIIYAMKESIQLLNKIYYKNFPSSLSRKFILSEPYLRT